MRKVTGLILAFLILSTAGVYAKNGDVVGHIYSTDIVAKIGENEVMSYNIGGRTAVICEDLENSDYGYPVFGSEYDDENRLLKVSARNPYKTEYKAERGKVGKILGDIYETDIKVIFNGSYINGYNIGGKTAILLEDLGDLTDSPNEAYGYSKYCAKTFWDEENRVITVDFANKSEDFSFALNTHQFSYDFKDGVITAHFDPLNPYYSECSVDENNKNDPYVIKPLYLDIDGEKEEIGTYYYNKNGYDDLIINDSEYIKAKLINYKSKLKKATTYSDTLSFFDDKVKYETFKSMKTEDYTLLLVRNLEVESYGVMYVAVNNYNGDFVVMFDSVSEYEVTELEKTGKNTVDVSEWPFGGPHGATTAHTEYVLEWYFD